jgi:hypothetical protein
MQMQSKLALPPVFLLVATATNNMVLQGYKDSPSDFLSYPLSLSLSRVRLPQRNHHAYLIHSQPSGFVGLEPPRDEISRRTRLSHYRGLTFRFMGSRSKERKGTNSLPAT